MYKRHSIWDEDKWDIHSDKGSSGSGYAGQDSDSSKQDYHSNEAYGANKPDEDKANNDYRAAEKEEEDKDKKNEEKEETIVDAVNQEDKYQKKEDEEDEFKTVAKDIHQENIENQNIDDKKGAGNKETKKKQSKSIEEAIKKAIKEEKDIVHAD